MLQLTIVITINRHYWLLVYQLTFYHLVMQLVRSWTQWRFMSLRNKSVMLKISVWGMTMTSCPLKIATATSPHLLWWPWQWSTRQSGAGFRRVQRGRSFCPWLVCKPWRPSQDSAPPPTMRLVSCFGATSSCWKSSSCRRACMRPKWVLCFKSWARWRQCISRCCRLWWLSTFCSWNVVCGHHGWYGDRFLWPAFSIQYSCNSTVYT